MIDFHQLGINITVLDPGVQMAMYHWEADQEDFLVVSGEALLVVEGEERPLRAMGLRALPRRDEARARRCRRDALRRDRGRRARAFDRRGLGRYTVDEAAAPSRRGRRGGDGRREAGVRALQAA